MSLSPPLRIAIREGIVLSIVSLCLALFYNSLTGKGIFTDEKPVRPTVAPGSSPEIIPLERAGELQASGALFVDSRHAFDFRLGHIPGAINIPLQGSDDVIAGLPQSRDKSIVVYCDGAECNSSLEVGAKFSAAGYSRVYVFFAGWTAWKGAGLAIEASPS